MKRHRGSTLALMFGIVIFLKGIIQGSPMIITGIIIILGALAYRSAKKRKIGEARSTKTRKAMEGLFIVIIFYLVLFQRDSLNQIIDHPVYFIIIPLWVVIAYIWVNVSKTKWLIFADREEKMR